MEKTRKWRKILAMMLTVVMMLQNAQSVMVFADVTNEQIEQRLAGNQEQTEETQPAQSQVDTRANGEEYKTQSQETQENGNGSTDIGSPESGNATTEAKTSNADVSATITQSVFQADVSGTTCNFVQMTAQITNNDAENPATGVSVKSLLNSSQLNYVNGYGAETSGAGAYYIDSNNTSDLPDGSTNGYDQIVMWTDQTIGAGETAEYQFAAQIIPADLTGVVDAWYVDGTSCSYTWQNTEILVPTQAPEETTPEATPEVTPETTPEVTETPEETPTPEVTETPEETPTPEVTEAPEETPTPEPTQAAEDKKTIAAKKKQQQKLLAQRGMEDKVSVQDGEGDQTVVGNENGNSNTDKDIKNCADVTYTYKVGRDEYNEGDTIPALDRDAQVNIKMTYTFKEDTKPTPDNPKGFYYDLPQIDQLDYKIPESGTIKGQIINEDGTTSEVDAGTWTRSGNRIEFNYDPEYLKDHPNNISGTFSLYTQLKKNEIVNDEEVNISFGNKKTTIKLKDTGLTGIKDYTVDADGNLIFTIVLTATDANAYNVNVTDTLTGNLQFKTPYDFKVTDSNNKEITENVTFDVEGQVAKIHIPKVDYGNPVTITYTVVPGMNDDSEVKNANSATWTWGKEGEDGKQPEGNTNHADKDVDFDNNNLTKTSVKDEENSRVSYTININEFGKQLLSQPNGKLILTDTLTGNASILENTIRLVDKNKQQIEGAKVEYINSKQLRIEIPDGIAAVLTYTVQVTGVENTTEEVTNSASLEGITKQSVTKTDYVKITGAGATVSGQKQIVRLKKISTYTSGTGFTGIPGATFKLSEIKDMTDLSKGFKDKVASATTADGTGEILFKDISVGRLYKVEEITQPVGYLKNTEPYYFVTYQNSGQKDTAQNLLKGSEYENKVNYIQDGVTFLFRDEPIPSEAKAEISVLKNLNDSPIPDDYAKQFNFSMVLESYTAPSNGVYYKDSYKVENPNDPQTISATEIAAYDADASSYYNVKVSSNNASVGKAVFPKIVFKYEGTYVFKVREIETTDNDYEYDNSYYEITFNVTKNNEKLNVTKNIAKYTMGSDGSYKLDNGNVANIEFNNREKATFTLRKTTNVGTKNDTKFTFNLTRTRANKNVDFSGVTLVDPSTKGEDYDKYKPTFKYKGNQATITLWVKKGQTQAAYNATLTGLYATDVIDVKETKEKGWITSADNSNCILKLGSNVYTVENISSEEGTVSFKVNKNYNDWRANNKRVFTFELSGIGTNNPPMPPNNTNSIEISSNSAEGTANSIRTESFAPIKFTQNGIYYYKVKEIPATSGKENGVDYADTVKYFKIEVESAPSAAGEKRITVYESKYVKENDEEALNGGYIFETVGTVAEGVVPTAEFTNTYRAETSVTFKGTKRIKNKELTNETFDFYIECDEKNLNTTLEGFSSDKYTEGKGYKVSSDANGDIVFPKLTYKQSDLVDANGIPLDSKTFTYIITEEQTSKYAGITADKDSYKVQVKVINDGKGNLTSEVKSITCDKIIQPDSSDIYLLPNAEGKTATFVNKYGASLDINITGIKKLENKELREDDHQFEFVLVDERDTSNVIKSVSNDGKNVNVLLSYDIEDLVDDDGNILRENQSKTFSYILKEKSQADDKPYITYDSTEYKVEVIVTNKGSGVLEARAVVSVVGEENTKTEKTIKSGDNTLQLPVPKKYSDKYSQEKPNFVNIYNAETTIQFEGTKALVNKDIKTGDFTFVIESTDSPKKDQRFINENGEATYKKEVTNTGDKIIFPDMTYTAADLDGKSENTFAYQISEKNAGKNINGIQYDSEESKIEIAVTVRDDGFGHLSTEVLYNNTGNPVKSSEGKYELPTPQGKKTTFTNVYGSSTKVQLKGTKVLENKEMKAGEFNFVITAVDSNDARFNDENSRSNTQSKQNGTPNEKGISEFIFDEMTYTAADMSGATENEDGQLVKSFNYTVSEEHPQSGKKDGITYDTTQIPVTVTLTDDGKGNLTAKVTSGETELKAGTDGIYALPVPEGKKASFTNVYDSTTSIKFAGTKALVNNTLSDSMPFEFVITGENDKRFTAVDPEGQEYSTETKKVGYEVDSETGIGKFTFPVMSYTVADLEDITPKEDGTRSKEFTYIITEDKSGTTEKDGKYILNGVTYDSASYTIKVNLTDDGKGKLTATVTPAEENVQLEATNGNEFTLYTLKTKEEGKTATFVNTYNAEATFPIKAVKYLNGRKFKTGDKFKFIVTKNNHEYDTVTIEPKETDVNDKGDACKEFEFKTDKYTLKDVGKTYHYSIREDHENKITGVTDSNRVYEITVEITDPNKNGKLKVVATEYRTEVNEDGTKNEIAEPFKVATFTNEYTANGTAQISAEKNLTPLELKDDQFSFTLTQTDKEGKELTVKKTVNGEEVDVPKYTQTVKNHGSNVKFEAIKYSQEDVGNTYYYSVKEDVPENIPKGYTYSNSEYRVEITVSAAEDEENKLSVTKKIMKVTKDGSTSVDTIIFDNAYKAEGSIEFTGKKEIKDYSGKLTEKAFNFIVSENGNQVATGTNDENGNIKFSKISYVYDATHNPIGTHTYIISELRPETGDGYIYDKTTRKVVVEVEDKGDGTLDASIVTGKDETTEEDISDVDIDAENNIVVKKFVNEEMGISFRKTDIADKEIEGATLTLYEYKDGKKGTEVTHWETKKDETHVVTSGLVAGNSYILEETKVPDGYVKADPIVFKINNDAERSVEIVSGGQKDKNGNIVMVDKKTGVQILKVNEDGKPLAGASLAIKDSTGNIIDQWVSTDAAHTIEGKLVEGAEYVLTEIKAPEGYKMASDVTFKANASDKPTVVTMKDDYTEVSIQKTDYNGKAISGATLELKDSTGKVIDTWKTDGTAHVLKGKLVEGAEYTLTETSAPSGYRVSLDIKFKVSKNEKVTTVTMKDAPTKASILKTDESGKALSGAQLVVKDSTGKEIDKWTTDGKAHEITGLLTVGETYTLSEVSAPSGYTVAPDQTFKMEDKDVVEVIMVDYQASGSGQITVTKKVTLAQGGDNVDLIAEDDTFYVNLFTDAAGKYPYKGSMPQAIHLVNASAGSVTFSNLAQGTYYVYETDANGNVIDLETQLMHNGSQFMCTVNGGSNTVKLDLKSGPKEGAVNLENVFYDIPDGYSYKGEINISKQVLKGNSQTTVDDTFYAGIFTKGDDGVYNLFEVVPLVQNDTVTVEVPLGGKDGTEPINYYILETDADGNILDLDVFEYEVTGEGTVALSKDNLAGNINLVNKIPEDTDGKLRVQKTDGNGVGLAGASFRLTDEDGSVIDEWTSEASAHELELEPGTYTLTEVQAPTGYTGAGSVTIKVDDDYNFSVSGEIDYSYKGGLLKIVNKATTSTPSSGTPVSGGSTPASYSSALSGKVAVKTGDNTPIGAYAAVLVIAALAIAGGIFYKKKRKNDK